MKSVVLSAAPFGRTKIEYFDSSNHNVWPARNPSFCLHEETIEYNLKTWLPAARVRILQQGNRQLELTQELDLSEQIKPSYQRGKNG